VGQRLIVLTDADRSLLLAALESFRGVDGLELDDETDGYAKHLIERLS
jgi:hypothetical protein